MADQGYKCQRSWKDVSNRLGKPTGSATVNGNLRISFISEVDNAKKYLFVTANYLPDDADIINIELSMFKNDADCHVIPQKITVGTSLAGTELTYVIPKFTLVTFLKLYAKKGLELNQNTIACWNGIDKLEDVAPPPMVSLYVGESVRLITPDQSLHNYPTWHITMIGGGIFRAQRAESALCFGLGCLINTESGRKLYEDWIHENFKEINKCAGFLSVLKRPPRAIPEDVLLFIGAAFYLSINKSISDDNWPRFMEQRKSGLQLVLGVTGLQVEVPATTVKDFSDQIRAVPGLLKFIFEKFIIAADSPLPEGYRQYLLSLSQYRGMTQFKLVKNFLEETPSFAHLKWCDVKEVGLFKAQLKEYIDNGLDEKYLSFTHPEYVLNTSHYPKLASLATEVAKLSVGSLRQFTGRKASEFPGLEDHYKIKIGASLDIAILAKQLGIDQATLAARQNILDAHGLVVGDLPENLQEFEPVIQIKKKKEEGEH